jgi:hypothetical protein
MRDMIATGAVSRRSVVDYLRGKAHLQRPSQALLNERTGKAAPSNPYANGRARTAGSTDMTHTKPGAPDVLKADWRESIIHGADGKPLRGGALKQAHAARWALAQARQPRPQADLRSRLDVLAELGLSIADLAREYKALCDEA